MNKSKDIGLILFVSAVILMTIGLGFILYKFFFSSESILTAHASTLVELDANAGYHYTNASTSFSLVNGTRYYFTCDYDLSNGTTTWINLSDNVNGTLTNGLNDVIPSATILEESTGVYSFESAWTDDFYAIWIANGTDSNIINCGESMTISDTETDLTGSFSLNLLYPQNSTSTYIHDFTHFTWYARNPDTVSHTYNFKIYLDTSSIFAVAPETFTRNIDYNYASGDQHYHNVEKLSSLSTSTTYYAKLCVRIDGGYMENCDNTITFQTGDFPDGYKVDTVSTGFNGATSTELYAMYPDFADFGTWTCDNSFYSPKTWACWAGKTAFDTMNQLKDYFVAGLNEIWTTTQDIFPVNMLVAIDNDFDSVVATTTDVQIVLAGQGTAFQDGLGGYRSYTVLTSSTVDSVAGTFDWEALINSLLYLMTGVIILGTSIPIIKRIS